MLKENDNQVAKRTDELDNTNNVEIEILNKGVLDAGASARIAVEADVGTVGQCGCVSDCSCDINCSGCVGSC